MPSNTTINATTIANGDTIRSIEKNGVKTQVVTIDLGGNGDESLPTGTLAVKDSKDTGRVNIAINCYQGAGITGTEALFAANTFAKSVDGVAAGTGQSFSVSAGKRFNLQSVMVTIKNTGTAATSKLALRYSGAGGVISNTSPILMLWDMGTSEATVNTYIRPVIVPVPGGCELIGGASFGFTNLSSAATMLHTIVLLGFEY